MRTFFYELRKIWRPVSVLALILINLIFYNTNLDYFLRTLPQSAHTTLDLYEGWREAFGVTLDADEIPDMEAQLSGLIAEANEIIAHWDETKYPDWAAFSDIGIEDFDGYRALLNKFDRTPEEEAVASLLLDSRSDFLYDKIRIVENVLEDFAFTEGKGVADYLYDGHESAKLARCAEIDATPGMSHTILPESLIDTMSAFAVSMCIILIISAGILLSPYLVRDQLSRMPQQQWTTRTGRRLFRTQLAAALFSALLLGVIELAVFGGGFCARWRISTFWECTLYGLLVSPTPWFTMSVGAYVLTLGGLALMLMLGAAALLFFLSQYSTHYVAMLLKGVPVCVALCFFGEKAVTMALFFANPLSDSTGIVGMEFFAAIGLLLAALSLCLFAARRTEHKELL